jgi:hypothetical protein
MMRISVQHQIAPVLLVDGGDLLAQAALETVDLRLGARQLVLHAEHQLDAREVEPELAVSRWIRRSRSTSASE